jgi:leucyl-tRNA synthetase
LAEELWNFMHCGNAQSLICDTSWPDYDSTLTIEATVTIAIQVNGKLRDEIEAPKGAPREDIEALVLAREKVQRALDGKSPRKVIVVPDRLVNLVA